MKKRLKITIGIPAFNEESNIGFLIEKLFKQVGRSFELANIIVISDGSTDLTNEVLKKFKNKKLIVKKGRKRMGQVTRQNHILNMLSKDTDSVIFFEADTLPKDNHFIERLARAVPDDGVYSMIVCSSEPVTKNNFTGKIIHFGTTTRFEIFEKAMQVPNVYLYSETGLLSKIFAEKLRLDPNFNEDSYIFRKAMESGLPVLRVKKAVKLYVLSSSLHDYFLQSIKYQKAKKKEKSVSNIYSAKILRTRAVLLVLRRTFSNPFMGLSYYGLFTLTRIAGVFYRDYNPFWNIYRSTKRFPNI